MKSRTSRRASIWIPNAAMTIVLGGCLQIFDLDKVYRLESSSNDVGGFAGAASSMANTGGMPGSTTSSTISSSVAGGGNGAEVGGSGGLGGQGGVGGLGGAGGASGQGGSGGQPTICGDNKVSGFEGCDDGGIVDGDGCSSNCSKEYTEIGALNDSFIDADSIGIVAVNDAVLSGSLMPQTDVDIFKWTLSADSVVRFETFEGLMGRDCPSAQLLLTIRDIDKNVKYVDGAMGIGSCGAIVAYMKMGTYYLQVQQNGMTAAVNAYRLEIKTLADIGTEQEPNNAPAEAMDIAGTDVYLFGRHQEASDPDFNPDWYRIQLNTLASIRVELIEGDAVETCESKNLDSEMDLYDSSMNLLVADNNSGRENCSLIDGTGMTPANPNAKNLLPGVYFLRVHSSYTNNPGMFDYRIALTLR